MKHPEADCIQLIQGIRAMHKGWYPSETELPEILRAGIHLCAAVMDIKRARVRSLNSYEGVQARAPF